MNTEGTTELEHRLRTASDALIAVLDELVALEEEKRTLDPGTPRFSELAERVEALARTALGHSRTQEALSRQTLDAGEQGQVLTPIDAIAPRPIHEVLSEWRAAERRLTEAAPGTPEHDHANADITRLRDEYRRSLEAAERTDA